MAQYLITSLSFIGNRLVKDGETIEVADDFIPGQHWQPVDDAAKKAFKAAGYKATLTAEELLTVADAVGPVSAP